MTVETLAVVLVGLSASMGLAHVLELPGKLRLTESEYRTVQPIYYPGFTIGGFVGEFGGILLTAALVALTPTPSPAFWLRAGALAVLLVAHGVCWLMTHPVNQFWLAGQPIRGAGRSFFTLGSGPRPHGDWRNLRDQWEVSHAVRAVLTLIALSLLLAAMRM